MSRAAAGAAEIPCQPGGEPKPGPMTTRAMSQWISILKALMLVQIISFHHDLASHYDQFIAWHVYAPHPLSQSGWACNFVFFALAGYFGLGHFLKLSDKPIREFTLLFAKQYFKRYVQLRAVYFVLAVGYEAFLYTVFGEQGRGTTYDAVRKAGFWRNLFAPYYQPGRHSDGTLSASVTVSGWFVLELMNDEAVFYVFFYLQHLLRRAARNDYAWGCCYVASALAVIVPCIVCGVFTLNIIYYCVGTVLCVLRFFLTRPKPYAVFQGMYSHKRAPIFRWALGGIFFYVWLFTGRLVAARRVSFIFIMIPLLLDICPEVRLHPFWETVVKEINRLQIEAYLVHSPFLESEMPRGMPQIVPRDFNYINPVTTHWFMAWQYPLLFIELAYPLWFLAKPLVEFVDWVDDRVRGKPVSWGSFGLGMASVACNIVIITLQQAGVFGRGSCPSADVRYAKLDWMR